MSKEELVKLCMKHKLRTAFLPGEDLDDPTETDAWSDRIEPDNSEDESTTDDESQAQPPLRRKARGS